MHSIFKRQEHLGEFHSLVEELSSHGGQVFPIFSDVTATVQLLELVAPDIMKKDTTYRKSIYFHKKCTRKLHILLLQGVEL